MKFSYYAHIYQIGELFIMKYKHIVFDIDGTLMDTEYAVLKSLQETLIQVTGEEKPFEALTFSLGIPGEAALEQLGMEDITETMILWKEIFSKYLADSKIFDGIADLLNQLQQMNCHLGIVTSKTRDILEKDFCKTEIVKFFTTIICADDTVTHKPTPAPLLKYMELTGAKKEEILYIGDSIYDSQCAHNAHVDFALAVWGSHTKETPAEYYPETPQDLQTLFRILTPES